MCIQQTNTLFNVLWQATVPEAKSVHFCEGIVPIHEIHNLSTCQHRPLLPKPEGIMINVIYFLMLLSRSEKVKRKLM